MTSYVVISGAASQARALFYCSAKCNLGTFKVYPVVTRYRVATRTLTDEVTGDSRTYQYSYEGAAVNDLVTSQYVANNSSGTHLMTKPYSEFRGHSHVTETNPDGRVVETWYNQDDIYKGQVTQTQVKDLSGNIYTQTNSSFNSEERTTGSLPHPQGQPADFYHDLEIWWVYTTSEDNRSYNGDSAYVATRNEYLVCGVRPGMHAIWQPDTRDQLSMEWK